MKDESKIILPNELERKQSIDFILNQVENSPYSFSQFIGYFLKKIDLSVIFGELREVIIVVFSVLISLLILGVQVIHTQVMESNLIVDDLNQEVMFYIFLLSPVVYALFHYLSIWKEYQLKTFELKMTYRTSLKELLIIRLLLFSIAALIISVFSSFIFWLALDKSLSLIRLVSISSASLFLFSVIQLGLDQKMSLKRSYVASPIIWLVIGIVLIKAQDSVIRILMWLPELFVVLIALSAIGIYIYLLRKEFLKQREGGDLHVRI